RTPSLRRRSAASWRPCSGGEGRSSTRPLAIRAPATPNEAGPVLDLVGAPSSPPVTRDCLDCGAHGGMNLQNAARTAPVNIPLLYVCRVCGAQLTIPPR